MTDETERTNVLVDAYGDRAPAVARFGKGISDRAGAQEAQDARRNLRPGDYDHQRRQ